MRMLNRPIAWWGTPDRETATPPTILELISAGTLTVELAADLWIRIASGASLIVAASPPRSGKTTLLTALLVFLPENTEFYFTRGWGETFDLPPMSDEQKTYLLINELSDHLPYYSWGPYGRKAFELLADGYGLASTMHADTPEEVVADLRNNLGVPVEHLTHIDLCITLRLDREVGRLQRRVNEVATFETPTEGQIEIRRLWQRSDDRLLSIIGSNDEDRLRRTQFLLDLLSQEQMSLTSLRQAVLSYTSDEQRG
jgi:type IV secretory pathway ATPase VirB11/archaellum biosynthesis ATPase